MENKYAEIPYGAFQGYVDHVSKELADGQSKMMDKLMKTKSRIEASDIINIIDDNGKELEVFYRVIDCCDNAQTDVSCDNYTIEQVLYKGRKVNLKGRGEQAILEHLNRMNPAGLKYSVRA